MFRYQFESDHAWRICGRMASKRLPSHRHSESEHGELGVNYAFGALWQKSDEALKGFVDFNLQAVESGLVPLIG